MQGRDLGSSKGEKCRRMKTKKKKLWTHTSKKTKALINKANKMTHPTHDRLYFSNYSTIHS